MLFSCFSFHALLQPIYRWDGVPLLTGTNLDLRPCARLEMCHILMQAVSPQNITPVWLPWTITAKLNVTEKSPRIKCWFCTNQQFVLFPAHEINNSASCCRVHQSHVGEVTPVACLCLPEAVNAVSAGDLFGLVFIFSIKWMLGLSGDHRDVEDAVFRPEFDIELQSFQCCCFESHLWFSAVFVETKAEFLNLWTKMSGDFQPGS